MEPPPAARSARTCGRRVSQDSPHQQAGNSRPRRTHRGFWTGSHRQNRIRQPRIAAPPLAARVVAQQASRKGPHPPLHHPSRNRDPHGSRDFFAFEKLKNRRRSRLRFVGPGFRFLRTSRVLRLKARQNFQGLKGRISLRGCSARPFVSSRKKYPLVGIAE